MTDKQIIIDGVDVSGCDYLAKKDDYCSYSGITYAYKGQCMCSDEEMCKEHPNCFYKKNLKKLKRKEQECEELKKKQRCAWKSLEGTFCPEAQEQLEAYKMEAEEGKEINAELKAENDNIKETFDGLFKVQYKLADNNKKLRQTLTEIKEIAEGKNREFIDNDAVVLEILQKISECEGNDDL